MKKYDKANLINLQEGESLLVRVPSLETCARYYFAHKDLMDNGSFFSTSNKQNDIYNKASEILMDLSIENYSLEIDCTEIPCPYWNLRSELVSAARIQLGFYDLYDLRPIVLDISLEESSILLENLKEHENIINHFPLEIHYHPSSDKCNSYYSANPSKYLLNRKRMKLFRSLPSSFDTNLYFKNINYKSESEQLNDLYTFIQSNDLDFIRFNSLYEKQA